MAVSDYTSVVARFADEVGAAVFAKFVASEGISCHIADLSEATHHERYGVRVQQSRIDELRQILQLKPVANLTTPFAAQVMAGRLAREGIPCCVAGEPGQLFAAGAAAFGASREFGHTVVVPESFLELAVGFLCPGPPSDTGPAKFACGPLSDPERPS
jgi:hypothetical protein